MLKKIAIVLVLGTSFYGCNKKKQENYVEPVEQKGDRTLHVKDYDKIDLSGNVTLHIHQSPTYTGEVRIKSGTLSWSSVTITSENKELKVSCEDRISLSQNVIIEVFVPYLVAIRLENNQHAIVYSDPAIRLANIDIVTEANSKLEIYNLNAASVTSRQEADSEVFFSSKRRTLTTPGILTGKIVVIDSQTIILDEEIIIKADVIESTTEGYKISGSAAEYDLNSTANFRAEGKSFINISELPVRSLEMKMEGESRANVWAVQTLSGKGEGKSILNYFGSPSIIYPTSGESKLIHQN